MRKALCKFVGYDARILKMSLSFLKHERSLTPFLFEVEKTNSTEEAKNNQKPEEKISVLCIGTLECTITSPDRFPCIHVRHTCTNFIYG